MNSTDINIQYLYMHVSVFQSTKCRTHSHIHTCYRVYTTTYIRKKQSKILSSLAKKSIFRTIEQENVYLRRCICICECKKNEKKNTESERHTPSTRYMLWNIQATETNRNTKRLTHRVVSVRNPTGKNTVDILGRRMRPKNPDIPNVPTSKLYQTEHKRPEYRIKSVLC